MQNTWAQALAPAFHLVVTPLPNTRMAMLIFREQIIEQVDFTAGQQKIAERLRQLRLDEPFGSKSGHARTALYDALLAGIKLLDNPTSADILYLVTDGGENASHTHLDEVTRRLTSSGVRLFVSFIFSELGYRNRTPEELNGSNEVKELIDKTGGEMIVPFANGIPTKPKEMEQFTALMRAFHRGMIENYLFELELSDPVEKRRNWELKLSKEKREQWKNIGIFYPSELSPCEP
jgi:hypothetical protein